MTTNIDRARIVSSDVELEAISLRSADLSANVDPLGEQPPELQLAQKYRGWYEVPDSGANGTRLDVFVEFKFAASDPDQDAPDLFSLDATYLLVYKVKDLGEKPADALQHFAQLNGPYNVWPYWRELVQTVAGRIGLGTVVVPVFRPPVRKIVEQRSAAPAIPPGTTRRVRKAGTTDTGKAPNRPKK